MRERALALLERLRSHVELSAVVSMLIAGGLAWSFAEITDEVVEHETHAFDRAVLLALREPGNPSDPLGPRWMHEVGRDITALGGVTVLSLLTAAVLGYLWMRKQYRAGWALLAGIAGAGTFTQLLKGVFGRPRPDLVPHMTEVYSLSFPSGHAAMSAATYLVLGMMLAHVHHRRAVRAYLVTVCVIIALLVGVSRVYVGVHWPTDVLAGWALGAVWALCVWTFTSWLERRGMKRSPAN